MNCFNGYGLLGEEKQHDVKEQCHTNPDQNPPPGGGSLYVAGGISTPVCIAFRILLTKLIPSQLRLSIGADADSKPQQFVCLFVVSLTRHTFDLAIPGSPQGTEGVVNYFIYYDVINRNVLEKKKKKRAKQKQLAST